MKANGKGTIGIKVLGEGSLMDGPAQRRAALRAGQGCPQLFLHRLRKPHRGRGTILMRIEKLNVPA